MKTSQAAQIADLKRQLDLIRQSAAITPGNLQNQIDGMALLMLSVARTLQMPDDLHIRDLPDWAAKVMARLTEMNL